MPNPTVTLVKPIILPDVQITLSYEDAQDLFTILGKITSMNGPDDPPRIENTLWKAFDGLEIKANKNMLLKSNGDWLFVTRKDKDV